MKKIIYFLLSIVPFFTGCASIYIPSPVNTPLFEDKGEVLIEAGVSTNGIFATAGYSFSKKYALIANGNLSFGNFAKFSDIGDLGNSYFGGNDCAHRSVELGFGRYNIVNISGWHLEMFGGARYGKAHNLDKKHITYESWHLTGFVQANFGRKIGKHRDIGWASRIDYSYFNTKEIDTKTNEILYENFSRVFLQQFMFFRFGGEHLKGVIHLGINMKIPPSMNNINHTILHTSIGICYRF